MDEDFLFHLNSLKDRTLFTSSLRTKLFFNLLTRILHSDISYTLSHLKQAIENVGLDVSRAGVCIMFISFGHIFVLIQ